MTVEVGLGHEEQNALRWLDRLWNRAGRIAPAFPATFGPPLRPAPALLPDDLQRKPLTVAGIVAGAGLMLGAALALRRKPSPSPDQSCEEIIARALCREDPETPTHRGPLWTGYRKDARRVLAALRQAGLVD